MKCDICGKEVKNLGVHKYHAHEKSEIPKFDPNLKEKLIVDNIIQTQDNLLSLQLGEIRRLLSRYHFKMETKILEDNGETNEIEIVIRIQL